MLADGETAAKRLFHAAVIIIAGSWNKEKYALFCNQGRIDRQLRKGYNKHVICKMKLGESAVLTKAELPECPVATTVQLIGNKWKLLILRNLMTRPWRFNELLKSLPGLSQKVLTDNLRAMEADGIITRTVYPEVPPRVEYALSELGESMRPIMKALEVWGTDYQKLVRNT